MGSARRIRFLGHRCTIQRHDHRRHVENTDDPSAFCRAQGVQQPDHIGDALRGLHAHGADEHGIAFGQVDRCAQELGDDQAARQIRASGDRTATAAEIASCLGADCHSEHVTFTTHRLYQAWLARIIAEPLPQATHLHVDAAIERICLLALREIHELIPIEHAIRVTQKYPQQPVFRTGEWRDHARRRRRVAAERYRVANLQTGCCARRRAGGSPASCVRGARSP